MGGKGRDGIICLECGEGENGNTLDFMNMKKSSLRGEKVMNEVVG